VAQPFVSVLTPVFNGEPYLAQAIESVLAQTYTNWEYVLIDNASTDRTPDVIRRYAEKDPRIRVHTNPALVPVIENHNIALREMSSSAKYVKFIYADDSLFPECLERMVDVAQENPSVGLVASYRLQGDWVDLDGLPYPSPVVPGHTICRWILLGFPYVFGPPTSHMMRADLVRRAHRFYDESSLHADEAGCYEVLQHSDFGFVHQVLSFSRIRGEGITFSRARRLNTYLPAALKILQRYGRVYLTPEEYEQVLKSRLDVYYRYLVQALVARAGGEVWEYHRRALAELGFPLSRRRLALAMLQHVRRVLFSPGSELPKVIRLFRHHGADDDGWLATEFRELLEAASHRAFVKWIERQEAARVVDMQARPGSAPIPSTPPVVTSNEEQLRARQRLTTRDEASL
jgi:glycosyltransferase involved in cell wall biosynthesis